MSNTAILFEQQNIRGENSDAFPVLAAQTGTSADRASSKFANRKCRGIIFIITIANKAGSFSVVPTIRGYDSAGTAFNLAAFTALTTDGVKVLCYYPGVLTGFSGTEAKVGQLPREWDLNMDYTGTPASDHADTKVDAIYLA